MYNNKEFADMALKIAMNAKTVYAKGCFGLYVKDAKSYARCMDANSYNRADKRQDVINAAMPCFAFDCSGLVKGILWGFNFDTTKTYGGAVYKSSTPDLDAAGFMSLCTNVSTSMSDLVVGDFMYMKGHCGIYVGNDCVVECTPKWKDCVQVTNVHDRKWLKHGRLPYVTYGRVVSCTVARPTLKLGSKGLEVSALQRNLNRFGFDLAVDGIYGKLTQNAVKIFQLNHKLKSDGIYGNKTFSALREELLKNAN